MLLLCLVLFLTSVVGKYSILFDSLLSLRSDLDTSTPETLCSDHLFALKYLLSEQIYISQEKKFLFCSLWIILYRAADVRSGWKSGPITQSAVIWGIYFKPPFVLSRASEYPWMSLKASYDFLFLAVLEMLFSSVFPPLSPTPPPSRIRKGKYFVCCIIYI